MLSESRKLYQIKAFTVTVSMHSVQSFTVLPEKGLRAGQLDIVMCTGLLVVCSVIIYHLNLASHTDQWERKSVLTFKGIESLKKVFYNVWVEVGFTFWERREEST